MSQIGLTVEPASELMKDIYGLWAVMGEFLAIQWAKREMVALISTHTQLLDVFDASLSSSLEVSVVFIAQGRSTVECAERLRRRLLMLFRSFKYREAMC